MIFVMLMHGLLFGKICNPETEEYDGMPTSGNVRRSDHASPWSPGQTSTNHTINGILFPHIVLNSGLRNLAVEFKKQLIAG